MGDARRLLRQVLVAVLLAAFVVACLRLAWWQLERYESPGGSLQNLGYTLQWPTFAIFAVFMWWRLRKLERARQQQPAPPQTQAPQTQAPPPPVPQPPPRPGTEHPGEPEDELAAYNRYLAQLAQKERDRVPGQD